MDKALIFIILLFLVGATVSHIPLDNVKFSVDQVDHFGRLPVSTPESVFDSKQTSDNAPLFWDEELVSGAGISSSWTGDRSTTVITSTINTAGNFIRQSYQWVNYQPGKAVNVYMTGILRAGSSGTGTEALIGQGNDENGLFFVDKNDTVYVRMRSYVTGAKVDDDVAQGDWNIDPLDGTGPSGVTAYWFNAQIFVIAYGWLGYNNPVFGIVVDRKFIPCHEFKISNNVDGVFMSTPNLPLRYQLITTASSPVAAIEATCTSVISYGGRNPNGVVRYKSTEGTHTSTASENVLYAVMGIRLKSTHLDAAVDLKDIDFQVVTASSNLEWVLMWNPTVAGTFTYNNQTNSAVQVAIGGSSNTVTNGYAINGGFIESGTNNSGIGSSGASVNSSLRLGSAIDGTQDELVLCVRPIAGSTAVDIEAALTWLELD